jgi:hypothetical protein
MPDPRPHQRRTRRLAPVAIACASLLLAGASTAAARTVEFSTPSPDTGIDLGAPAPTGASGKVRFRVNRGDREAVAAAKQQQRLTGAADRRSAAAARANQRIVAIQELLDSVEADRTRLEGELRRRAVERYKEGDSASLEFLLSGDGLSDLLTRSEVLRDQDARDQRLIRDYVDTSERIEVYQRVLEELRDINGEQASDLRDRATRLDDVMVAARAGHDEAPVVEDEGTDEPEGVKGTWYVMDGAFTAQLFLPNAGSGYSGGTITVARRATPLQIQQVLSDKRIDVDASGYGDIVTGQIDGRLLDAMLAAANRFGYVRITSLKSDHGVYTASGNVSEHSMGCAMDIGTIGSTYINPAAQVPGGEVQQAVVFFDSLARLTGKPDLAPHQVISLFDLGGSTLALSDHGDHIHVGYAC